MNIIGSHFELTHTQNKDLGLEERSKKIEKHYNKLKDEIYRDTLSNRSTPNFSINNSSLDPTFWSNEYPLTNYKETKDIFRKFNNKKSSGIDGIPNIILKNLPKKIIGYYTMIFNSNKHYLKKIYNILYIKYI